MVPNASLLSNLETQKNSPMKTGLCIFPNHAKVLKILYNSMCIIHVFGESGKHDTFSATVNIRKVLEVLERKKLWKHDDISVKRIFLQTDVVSKE